MTSLQLVLCAEGARADMGGVGLVPVPPLARVLAERGHLVRLFKSGFGRGGMEYAARRGQTIRACQPRIAITLYHPGQDASETIRYLRDLVSEYRHRLKGTSAETGNPVMGYFWVE